MPTMKSLPLHHVPLRVLYIFRQMYNREIKKRLFAQMLHGVYLSYLLSIYLIWLCIALATSMNILNGDYYGCICAYFIGLSIVSHSLNRYLCKLLGLYNPLTEYNKRFLCTETSVQTLVASLADADAGKIYRPVIYCQSRESADLFFKISDSTVHKLFVLEYVHEDTGAKIFHIVDSTLTKPLHVHFDEKTSIMEVF